MKLQSKFALTLVPLVTIPMLYLGWTAIKHLQEVETVHRVEQLQIAEDQMRKKFEELQEDALKTVEILRKSPVVWNYLLTDNDEHRLKIMLPDLRDELTAMQGAYPFLSVISVLRTNGIADARIAPDSDTNSVGKSVAGISLARLKLLEPDRPFITLQLREKQGDWCMLVGSMLMLGARDPALPTDNRAHLGYLVMEVTLNAYAQQVYSRTIGKSGAMLLVDAQGRLMLKGQAAGAVTPWGAMAIDIPATFTASTSRLVRLEGMSPFIARATALMPGLYLVAHMSHAEATAMTPGFDRKVWTLTLIGVVTSLLVMALALRHHVLHSVRALNSAAEEIQFGNMSVPIPESNSDELGELGRSFAAMRLGVARSKAEIASYQKELEEKVAAAQSANQAKSQFLANMSHEVRTPINGVIGMLYLLGKTTLDSKQKRYVSAALSSADTLMMVIGDVLDFSKIEAGRFELESVEFDLREALDVAVRLFAGRAESKGLDLACVVDSNVPKRLIGDENRLKQIVINLLNNAVKFTEKGEIFVSCALEKESADEASLRIEVRDTGPGIPPAAQAKIFESFTQADESMQRKHGGTGLGLTIAKRLAMLMKGAMGVKSEVGKGSTFWFTVRLRTADTKMEARPFNWVDLSGRRLLVVDDMAGSREVVQTLAGGWGCEVVEAGDVAGACEMFKKASKPFDVVLLDQGVVAASPALPATLDVVQSNGARPKLVLLDTFSAKGVDGDAATHISGRLSKPIREHDLYKAIASALNPQFAAGFTGADSENGPEPTTLKDLGVPHILLADDNEVNQEVASEMLKFIGCTCKCVGNGIDALAETKTGEYDLVLMDCQMPGMDGYETTRRIRQWESEQQFSGKASKQIPIVALTAHAMAGDREKCREAGMSDYLTKPIQPDRLLFVLGAWLKKHGVKRRTPAPVPAEAKPAAIPAPTAAPAKVDSPGTASPDAATAAVLKQCMGNKELATKLLGKFLQQSEIDIANAGKALQQSDGVALAASAHRIKGAAANLGLESVRAVAYELEKMGKEGSLVNAPDRIAALRKAMRGVAEMPLARPDAAQKGVAAG